MTQPDNSQARIAAIAATDALREAVRDAIDMLRTMVVDARVFAIPTQGEQDSLPPTAPVVAHAGDAGIDTALRALGRLEYDDGQHPMATVRCPGVLAVDGLPYAVIDELNRRKQALRQAMSAFGTSGWYTWRAKVPGWAHLNRLQAYREWHAFDEPLRRVGLSWAGHTHGIEQLRIGALIERLHKQNRHHGHTNVETELEYLAGFDPDEVAVIRKPVAPTPVANVVFANGRRRMVKTALPLIVRAPLPAIGDLNDFMPSSTRQTREDRAIDTLLVEHWHAWRYQPGYRFRLPANPVHARLTFDHGLWITPKTLAPRLFEPPRTQQIQALRAALSDVRGPVPGKPALDAPASVRVVGANRAHAYLVSNEQQVWRVPLGDLNNALSDTDTQRIAYE